MLTSQDSTDEVKTCCSWYKVCFWTFGEFDKILWEHSLVRWDSTWNQTLHLGEVGHCISPQKLYTNRQVRRWEKHGAKVLFRTVKDRFHLLEIIVKKIFISTFLIRVEGLAEKKRLQAFSEGSSQLVSEKEDKSCLNVPDKTPGFNLKSYRNALSKAPEFSRFQDS